MPNAQGGYTPEEEAEAVARAMQAAVESRTAFAPEQNPTVEQQSQQVANNLAQGLLSQNAEYSQQQAEQRGILDVLGTTLGYGLGPPYAASDKPYTGPPPMEAQPDWNYDSGYPGNWHDFTGNSSTGGGFFAFDEIFNHVPDAFSSGSNRPSTNNYRLLPPEYRKPNYIMRNGAIIDLSLDTWGPYGRGEFGGRYENPSWRGGSALGVPAAHAFGSIAGTVFGWPGALQYGYINPAN